MKCEICGRDYIALGVHIRRKHKVDPDDYRDEFGILHTTPLVDDDLSKQLSALMKVRLQDEEYMEEVTERCKKNGSARKGENGYGMTAQGKAALAKRNASRTKVYKVWVINGIRYESSGKAAKALGVDQAEVVRKCNGYKSKGKTYPPKEGWASMLPITRERLGV